MPNPETGTTPIVRIEHARKEFSYTSTDVNSNANDMWFDYLLGLLGRSKRQFAAQRKHTVAVDDVSLEVMPGELFGLLGPNGAGKTTLIKMLATILRPTSGTIAVSGFDTVRQAAQARSSLNVVAASGWFAFDMQLTLLQNLIFWGRLCGLDRRVADERSRHALELVDLAGWANETPNNLSSGMRQRLALARGLLVYTPLFLLDEPTANVDPLIGYQIRDFLRNTLNRQLGQTIVLATHNMAEAEALCDRVAIISAGKVLACERPERLTRDVEGRVAEFSLTEDAVGILARVRDSGVTMRLVDTSRDGATEVRTLLARTASLNDLRDLLPGDVEIALGQPNLEDAFVHRTGRSLSDGDAHADAA